MAPGWVLGPCSQGGLSPVSHSVPHLDAAELCGAGGLQMTQKDEWKGTLLRRATSPLSRPGPILGSLCPWGLLMAGWGV